MHANPLVPRQRPIRLMVALAALLASLGLATAAHAEGSGNPNDYACGGNVHAGTPEAGSSEPQVQYTFTCSGPITGYQLQSQVPLTGFESSPLVVNRTTGEATNDSFSCGGEVPGYAVNCVGSTQAGYEKVFGQFSIGKPICAEPRVDPLLTVTYAYLEKGIVTQAISGPFDIGRPLHCPADGYNGGTRLAPREDLTKANQHKKHTHKKKKKKKKRTSRSH